MALRGWFLDCCQHSQNVIAMQKGDPFVAMLDTEAFNDAAASFLRIRGKRVPFNRLVIHHNERVDGPGQRPAGTDFAVLIRNASECCGIGRHELFRAGHAWQRDRFCAAAPKVVAHARTLAISVGKTINIFEFNLRHRTRPTRYVRSWTVPRHPSSRPTRSSRPWRPRR